MTRRVLEDPDAERRMAQLEDLVRAKVAGLLRAPVGGSVTLWILVEGGRRPRIGRGSTVTVEEKPLTSEAV